MTLGSAGHRRPRTCLVRVSMNLNRAAPSMETMQKANGALYPTLYLGASLAG